MRLWVHAAVADPNTAFLLVAVGLLAVYRELCAPGSVLPGTLGGVLLLLGIFGLSRQPLRLWALALLGAGITLLVASSWAGILTARGWALYGAAAGVLACCLGFACLIDDAKRIHPLLVAGVAGPVAVLGACLWAIAVKGTQLKSIQSLLR